MSDNCIFSGSFPFVKRDNVMITVMFGRNRQLQELKITSKTLDVSFMKQAPSVSQVQLFASL